MTHQNDYNLSAGTIEEITRNGLDAVPELMRVLLNNIMQVERSRYLQAGEYERTADRKGHANGYKPKTVRTRLGEITFAVPQVREGGFYPSALKKGCAASEPWSPRWQRCMCRAYPPEKSRPLLKSCAG